MIPIVNKDEGSSCEDGGEAPALTKTQRLISDTCDEIKKLLLIKNREYGNSAVEPINVFSRLNAEDQIKVRIDDKIKRIQQVRTLGVVAIHEDTELDLIGYLVLLRVARSFDHDQG